MKNKTKNRSFFILLSILILILDQLTKYLIILNYKEVLNKEFTLFSIKFVKNFGAAFNIFSGNRIFLCSVSIAFSIILAYLILRKRNIRVIELYSYTFILGGSLGNGIDRLLKGYVVDFINLIYINFPVFNIADISINIGFILILYSLFYPKK